MARAVARGFRRASVHAGAHVLEARVTRPYGLAPSMTLSVRDPAAFLKYRLINLLDYFGRHLNRYEGYYIGIVDAHGKPVLAAGNFTRIQGGTYWVQPALDSCSPILHSGNPFCPQPPRCPA